MYGDLARHGPFFVSTAPLDMRVFIRIASCQDTGVSPGSILLIRATVFLLLISGEDPCDTITFNHLAAHEEEMSELATRHYIDLTDEEAEDFTTIIDDVFESYERLDQLEDPSPEVTYTNRDPRYKPREARQA